MRNIFTSGASARDDQGHALIEYARRQAELAKDAAACDPEPALPEDSFPGYTLVEEIHRGGQGVVYKATQASTRRTVAIKVLRDGTFADRSARLRFEREVRILSQLRHPNIVTLHDGGSACGHHFYVMDYIPGLSLDDFMRNRVCSIADSVRLFLKICSAVAAAHVRGVIHRDLKPKNILIDESDEPHILDFGLAKHTVPDGEGHSTAPKMTMTGQFVGSLPWASPEQAECAADSIDLRTDVYALGLILFHMLTERFPYDVAGAVHRVLRNVVEVEPDKPSTLQPQIDHELDAIVLKCLDKDRAERYQSAGELARDIERYLAGEPIEARSRSGWYMLTKTARRHRTLLFLTSSLLLATAIYAGAMTMLYRRATAAEREAERAAAISRENFRRTHETAQTLVGEVSDRLGRISGASETRRIILEHAYEQLQGLTSQRMDDPEVLSDVARAHHGLGDIAQSLGKLDEAEDHLLEAFSIRQELAEASADDPTRLSEVSIAGVRVGDIAKQRDDLDRAEEYYARALEIDERLARLFPSDVRFLDNLTWSYDRLGDLAQRRNDLSSAADYYALQADLAAALTKLRPDRPVSLSAVRAALGHQTELAALMEDWPAAIGYGTACIRVNERLVALEPDHPDYLDTLVSAYLTVAWLQTRSGLLGAALVTCAKAKKILGRLIRDEPNSRVRISFVQRYAAVRAAIAASQGTTDEVATQLQIRLKALEALVQLDPVKLRNWSELFSTLHCLAVANDTLGSRKSGFALARRAQAMALETIGTNRESPAFLITYAKMLNDKRWPDLHDLSEAIRVCERAAEWTDHPAPATLRLLGELYVENGQMEQAVATLDRALAIAQVADSPLRSSIHELLDRYAGTAPER